LLQRRWGWRALAIAVPVIALLIFGRYRLRPALQEPYNACAPVFVPLQDRIHLLLSPDGGLYRGGTFGFVSSHASNHFGIAAFMIGVLRGSPRWAAPALLFWAAFVSYSRIYLGVHYPGDILVGGLWGTLVGFLVGRIYVGLVASREHA
jgi:undecaprenyl-diphosphatase